MHVPTDVSLNRIVTLSLVGECIVVNVESKPIGGKNWQSVYVTWWKKTYTAVQRATERNRYLHQFVVLGFFADTTHHY